MRVLAIDNDVFWEVHFETVGERGGVERRSVSVLGGIVDRLPPTVDAILACSDLQGIETERAPGSPRRLLGEVLAEELAVLAQLGESPPAKRIGVLLCGDFYVGRDLEHRGRHGDVRPVWRAFRERFRWVVGVAGNHDIFGDTSTIIMTEAQRLEEAQQFQQELGVYILDGDVITVDGMTIAGVSGIIGNASKHTSRPFRKEMSALLASIRKALSYNPEILLLHQGPEVSILGLPGEPVIYTSLEKERDLLVICGHVSWPIPLATLPNDVQVLNMDERAILLRRADLV